MSSHIVRTNHQALRRAFAVLRASSRGDVRDVLLLSPSLDDVRLARGELPGARLLIATRETWDLNRPFPLTGKVDLVVASNVFHYSPDPELWFRNVLAASRRLVLQDLITRRRSAAENGLCDDGDNVRYCFSARGVKSDFSPAFDLTALGDSVTFFEEYAGGRNEYHPEPGPAPRHYCAILQSPAAAPTARLSWAGALRFRWPALVMSARGALRPAAG